MSTGRTTAGDLSGDTRGGHGQVWINTDAGVYHREGSPFYGTTLKSKYMTEQDAIQAEYKRASKAP